MKYPNNYIYKSLDDDVKEILCYVSNHIGPDTQWRIALPESMLDETVNWFHIFMGHPGENRLIEPLQKCYHHNKICHTIDKYKCEHCQRHSIPGKGYGLLPEREMKIVPWE